MLNDTAHTSLSRRLGRLRLVMAIVGLLPLVLALTPDIVQAEDEPALSAQAARLMHIGLQVGHWQTNALPDELARLRTATGGSGGGVREVDVNLAVAQQVAARLRDLGHTVDILPATVPVGYQADVFLSIHADATSSAAARGFKLARSRTSRQPQTEDALIASMREEYGRATGLPWSPSITRNMTGYYALSRRFQHAIAPTTPGVILEMGYLTNVADRAVLTSGQDRVVDGIVRGLVRFAAGDRAPEQLVAVSPNDCRQFPETGQEICGPFKQAWEQRGGLAQFGYPISDEVEEEPASAGRERTVQYFERARLEYVRELAGTPDEIQLGLLGRDVTTGRETEARFMPIVDPGDGSWFPETGHTLRGGFRHFWIANGGLSVFGFPISEEFQEVNPADGQTYTVQYFERARFEYHPEHKGTPFETQLGLLGRQLYAGG